MVFGTFTHRRAIVTGGSKGLGKLIATQLVQSGAKVALLARESEELRFTAADLGANAVAIPCDLRDASVALAVDAAAEAMGGIDLLVNNAGVFRPALTSDASEDDLLVQVETNLLGAIRVSTAALRHLRANAHADIVNISSEAAADPRPFAAIYSATKAGIEAFSEALRHELRDDRIRVLVVRAGRMETSTIQAEWAPGLRDAFYAGNVRSGHFWRSGDAMEPTAVAGAVMTLVALPHDSSAHLVEIRGR
jgi:NADP-dependent 3-hydroxy acid dehydrogenase YdfG